MLASLLSTPLVEPSLDTNIIEVDEDTPPYLHFARQVKPQS